MSACADCGKPIRKGAKRCKAHDLARRNRSPEMRERSRASMLEKLATGKITRNNAAIRASLQAFYADPAQRVKQRERGAVGMAMLTEAHIAARGRASALTRKEQFERSLAWCPMERRDELRRLIRRHGAEEGRRIMRDDLATQERRRLAAMTSHERAMEKLANGAKLIEVRPLRRAEHGFTLGGVAPEAM